MPGNEGARSAADAFTADHPRFRKTRRCRYNQPLVCQILDSSHPQAFVRLASAAEGLERVGACQYDTFVG